MIVSNNSNSYIETKLKFFKDKNRNFEDFWNDKLMNLKEKSRKMNLICLTHFFKTIEKYDAEMITKNDVVKD